MADYWTQGTVSPRLPLDNETVAALGLHSEDLVYHEEEGRYEGSTAAEVIFASWLNSWGGRDDGRIGICFNYMTQATSNGFSPYLYYLYFEEYLDDFSVHVLQQILKKMPSVPHIVVEYVNTCSKMRQDGFGGGAIIITRDKIHRANTSQWIDETIERLKKAKEEE